MTQTTFADFGVSVKKKRKKKVVQEEVKVVEPTVPKEPEIDYDKRKLRTLGGLHLCFGSTWVYRYDNKILGTGDLRYYEDPIFGKKQMYRDIFHNFKVLRKMMLGRKETVIGKDYDCGMYYLKCSKKEVENMMRKEISYENHIFEITEDAILDYNFIDMMTVKMDWET